MPKIQIRKDCSLEPKICFDKIKRFLENDKDLKNLDGNYQCQFEESTLSGSAKGKMFDAQMKVTGTNSQSTLEIIVSIPLMATPFKGKIETMLQKKIDSLLV